MSATTADLPRVAQLTQKTNQFNASLKRRSEAELASLSSGSSIYVLEVTDRLGDYGLVGVCILGCSPHAPDVVDIDPLLISCRALGRGVEDAAPCEDWACDQRRSFKQRHRRRVPIHSCMCS